MLTLRLRSFAVSIVVSVLVMSAGCGGGGGGGGTGMGGMGGGGGSCPTSSATGTLSLRFAGSPLDTGLVNLPPGTDEITVDSDVTLPAGPHDVWAYNIAGNESPFRPAYEPTVPTQTACVRAGEQTIVTVTYRLVETSGLLWLGASNNPTASTMFGYGPTSVGSTGPASALVAANTYGADGFTFDQWGNMWVIGGTTADDQIARYPSALFATDGAKTPDIVINSFGSSIPGASVLAFDIQGNLWVSVVADNKVVKFTADDLSAANPTASVEMSGIDSPGRPGVRLRRQPVGGRERFVDHHAHRREPPRIVGLGRRSDHHRADTVAGHRPAHLPAGHRVRRQRQPVGQLRRHPRPADAGGSERHRERRPSRPRSRSCWTSWRSPPASRSTRPADCGWRTRAASSRASPPASSRLRAPSRRRP